MTAPEIRVARMLDQLDVAWQDFQGTYAGLTEAQLLIPGVTGDWSVRDLIAHVAWWDAEAITHLPLVLRDEPLPRYSRLYGGIDAFNALMTERKRGLSLDEVRREFVETHGRLVAFIESVPPAEIVARPRFRHRLKLDTFGHYPIHAADIRAWRREHDL